MEIDALHCDVVVQSWERFTGRKPRRYPRRKAVSAT